MKSGSHIVPAAGQGVIADPGTRVWVNYDPHGALRLMHPPKVGLPTGVVMVTAGSPYRGGRQDPIIKIQPSVAGPAEAYNPWAAAGIAC